MNRCWMLGTLVFGSLIAVGRNLRVTLDVVGSNVGIGGIMFGTSAPGDERNRLRRILQDEAIAVYSFTFYDEESLSKERSLYRSNDEEMIASVTDLIERATLVLNSVSTMTYPVLSSNLNIRTAPALYQVEEAQQNTTILGLAYFMTGSEEYAIWAVSLMRRWFIDTQTQMTPMDLYHSRSKHFLYQLLDAMQMVQGYLEEDELTLLHEWFRGYDKFIQTEDGPQSTTKNMTGLYYDIQELALAHYLRDKNMQKAVYKRAVERLMSTVNDDGSLHPAPVGDTCEHELMHTLQGWWTLARLSANAVGQTLWTEHKEALCRASEYAIPYFNDRKECSSVHDDTRWWPVLIATTRNCPKVAAKQVRWREWMTIDSKEIPTSLYSMPRHYADEAAIPPFWNLGTFVKKNKDTSHPDKQYASKTHGKDEIYIPAKMLKLAETDPEMETRIMRIRRWYQLGQTEIAERMLRKAIKDLRGTKVVWQPKDIIPQAMIDAAKYDEALAERIGRIRRWDNLGQTSIVERMIKKSLEELKLTAEDEATVNTLQKQSEELGKPRGSFLRAQQTNEAPQQHQQQQPSLLKKLLKPRSRKSVATHSMEIPPSLISQAQNDPDLAKRIHRINRWKKLGQHEIVDKMIKKLMASTEDQTF